MRPWKYLWQFNIVFGIWVGGIDIGLWVETGCRSNNAGQLNTVKRISLSYEMYVDDAVQHGEFGMLRLMLCWTPPDNINF